MMATSFWNVTLLFYTFGRTVPLKFGRLIFKSIYFCSALRWEKEASRGVRRGKGVFKGHCEEVEVLVGIDHLCSLALNPLPPPNHQCAMHHIRSQTRLQLIHPKCFSPSSLGYGQVIYLFNFAWRYFFFVYQYFDELKKVIWVPFYYPLWQF